MDVCLVSRNIVPFPTQGPGQVLCLETEYRNNRIRSIVFVRYLILDVICHEGITVSNVQPAIGNRRMGPVFVGAGVNLELTDGLEGLAAGLDQIKSAVRTLN